MDYYPSDPVVQLGAAESIASVFQYLQEEINVPLDRICQLAEQLIASKHITISHDGQFFVLSEHVSVPVALAVTGCIERRRDFASGLLQLALETFHNVDENTSACLCFSRMQQCSGKARDVYNKYYYNMYKGRCEIHHVFVEVIQLQSNSIVAFATEIYAFLLSHLPRYEDIDKFITTITAPLLFFDAGSEFGHRMLIAMQDFDIRPRKLAKHTVIPTIALGGFSFYRTNHGVCVLRRKDMLLLVLHLFFVKPYALAEHIPGSLQVVLQRYPFLIGTH